MIACPGDQSVQAAIGETQVIVRWSAVTATDNAGTPMLISMEPQIALFGLTGGTFSIGNTNVRYVYSDSVGNLATCAFNVEVRGNYLRYSLIMMDSRVYLEIKQNVSF